MGTSRLELTLPGNEIRIFKHLVLDYTGTLSRDGSLLEGIAQRLVHLASSLHITIMTADTFGMAAQQLEALPVTFTLIQSGAEKAERVRAMGRGVIAIGNGRNDIPMMAEADLRIAVMGPEGAAAALLKCVDVVVCNPCDALDLLIHPLRLKATLRD